MNRRMERINALLRQEISRVLTAELRDPRLSSMVSVVRVEASPDLGHAKVLVSVLGDGGEKTNTLKALRSASGYVRNSLRHNATLRAIPQLEFAIDESIEQGAEVLKLIDDVAEIPNTGETA